MFTMIFSPGAFVMTAALTRLGICLFSIVAVFNFTGCRQDANFHIVDDGKLYRSAQLTKDELELAIKSLGIRTVINLRGESDAQWYLDEHDITAQRGVKLVNITDNVFEIPNRDDLLKLLDAYRTAERPILVHCQRGIDRTGQASAIYQMLYQGKTRAEAEDMLSAKYGYSATLVPSKIHFIRQIWQGEDWARTQYDPCSGAYDPFYYNPNRPECAPRGPSISSI
jgi:protein tyrosine/serine phosphatase